MSQRTYRILLTSEPEGGFTVNVPALPGCITFGENIEHSMAMAKEAIELYVETLQADGEPVPGDSQTFEYSLVLASSLAMTKAPSLSPDEIIRLPKKHGFELARTKGSHPIFKNKTSGKMTVVPMHKRDLPKGTMLSILKQAGIDKEELL